MAAFEQTALALQEKNCVKILAILPKTATLEKTGTVADYSAVNSNSRTCTFLHFDP